MFNFMNHRPLMDADSDVGGGAVAPQETAAETLTESTVEATTEATTTDTSTADATDGATETPKGETEPATQPKQTAEMDAAFADLRRKADTAERRAMELETQRQSDREVAKKYGQQYGVFSDADVAEKYGQSHGIKTIAEFETALRNEEYQAKGIDPEIINKIVNEHPSIKAAQAAQQAAAKVQEDRFLVDSFSELSKEFSEVADAKDVPPAVWRVWQNGKSGISLKQAYVAVNYEAIATKKADAAKQAALNNIQSKDHVRGNGKGTEADTVRIDDETMAMYKRFNPKATNDEIKAHYKKSQK